jgi:hypothetical protein
MTLTREELLRARSDNGQHPAEEATEPDRPTCAACGKRPVSMRYNARTCGAPACVQKHRRAQGRQRQRERGRERPVAAPAAVPEPSTSCSLADAVSTVLDALSVPGAVVTIERDGRSLVIR